MKSGAFPSMLRVDFRRVFSSFGFYATVLCKFLVFLLSASEEIQLVAGSEGASVYYFFNAVNSFNSLADIMLIVATLPFALSFCEDWQNKYYRSLLIRSNISSYCWARALVCFLTTFLAIFLGMMVFIGVLSIWFPITAPGDGEFDIFKVFALNGKPMVSLTFFCVIRGFASAFWSIVSLTFSAYIANVFVALTAPLIVNKLLAVLFNILLPYRYSISFLTEGIVDMGSWSWSLAFPCLLFTVLSLILILLFKSRAKEVLHNA